VRGANVALREEVSNAQRLLSQAQNLMEAPLLVETGTGKTLPLPDVDVDPGEYESQLAAAPAGTTPEPPVKMVLDEKLNPSVGSLLNRAAKIVEDALKNTQADDAHQALARSVLARIHEQKGFYLARAAGRQRDTAYARLAQGRDIVGTLTEQKGILSYYDEVLSLEDDDVKAMKNQATSTAAELGGEIETLSGKIESLQKQQEKLLEKKNKLEATARSYRAEARAPGKKGYEADIKALEVMDRIGEIDSQLSAIDNQISSLEMQLSERKMKLSIAQAQIAAADRIVTGREKGTDPNGMGGRQAVRQERAELNQQHERSLAIGKEILQELADALKNWHAADKEAGNAYYNASTNFERYGKLAGSAGQQDLRVDALAQQAAVEMSFGRSSIERYYLHAEVEELLERLEEVWPGGAPAETTAIRQQLAPTTEQIRKTGRESFRNAVTRLEDAISRAEPAVRWLYQGAKARAYIGMAELSGEMVDLTKAETALNEALEGQAESPAVAANVGQIKYDLAALRAMLGG
jgi:hypothetical protein